VKTLLFLSLLFFTLFAQNDFLLCKQKLQDSHSFYNNKLYLLLENNLRVSSEPIKGEKALKYDPFLSLYLYKNKQNFQYPFRFNHLPKRKKAIISENVIKPIFYTPHQVKLLLEPLKPNPAVVVTPCCFVEGIVTKRGYISKEFIEHFINKDSYGDIGVRVGKDAKVMSVDILFPNNPFKKGDKILYLGKKRYNSMADILLLDAEQYIEVTLRRGTKTLKRKVYVQKRVAGGLLSDTFLEKKGLVFDKKLSLMEILPNKYGLVQGDKLLKVNGVDVLTQEDVRRALKPHNNLLLFWRDGFEFFVKIN